MKTLLTIISTLLLMGCSQHAEHPTQLDNSNFIFANNNLLNKNKFNVPQDLDMKKKEWKYKLKVKKQGDIFFKNHQIVKSFYLAHHANHIMIRGRKSIINQYKLYFISNGVKAPIELKPTYTRSNKVTIILSNFNKKLIVKR